MIISKDILPLAKLAKGFSNRPLHIFPDGKIMATDGFSLIEVNRKISETKEDAPLVGEWFEVSEPLLLDPSQIVKKQKFEKNMTLPILNYGFLLKAEAGQVKIRTTDLETATDVTYNIGKGEPIEYKKLFPSEIKQGDTFKISILIKTIATLKDLGVEEVTFMREDGDKKPLILFAKEVRAMVMPTSLDDDKTADYNELINK